MFLSTRWRESAVGDAVRAWVEPLENRTLLALVAPALSRLPGAPVNLFLAVAGHPARGSMPAHGPLDMDGDPTSFSAPEIDAIKQIYARTADAYSPFKLNVTTVWPGAKPRFHHGWPSRRTIPFRPLTTRKSSCPVTAA